ncbi:noroxomaritidine synthase 2-like [Magnolia sinica]|uniref:noroxomaritidine synthase 2-like n=1 Tax=Magnolia sinica TaxID=86752 RepID=UPI002659F774|nr:noroxomaritidine synthase 2-like [Magnolia sinica]
MGAWVMMNLWCYPEILLAFACFFFIYILRNKNKVLVNWPLVGMLPSLLLNLHRLHDWCTQLLRQSGSTFEFHGPWLAGMELLITCDPANTNHILSNNFSNYPKGSDFSKIFDILGDGIFNSDSDVWQVQRKMAHTLMNAAKFRQYVAKRSREKVENGLMPVLEYKARRGDVVDLQDVLKRFTFDSTCILVFGADPGSLSLSFPTVPFSKAMDDAMEVLMFRHVVPESCWMLLRWLKIGEEKKFAEAWKTIDCFINEHISKRMEELTESKMDTKEEEMDESVDLLKSYIKYRCEDETGISKSDGFLRDTVMNLMLAGRDTVSAGLTWFCWLISKNPRVESKILDELRATSIITQGGNAQKPAVFEPEELSRLVYLHAALCESLRLFPPVPFEHKGVLQQEILPSGEVVRPSTKIMFSLYAMGRMEGIWGEDCLEFKPERWITERGRLRFEPSYKFIAFNAGPRTCLGKDVAFTQMKVAAAAVLYNFHFEVVDGHPVEPKISIILHMKNGLMVRIRERRCA